jgi:hypothetical protein
MLHDGLLVENADVSPQVVSTEPIVEITPIPESNDATVEAEPEIETTAESTNEIETAAVNETEPEVEESATEVSVTVSNRVLMEVTASILNVRAEANVESDVLIKLAGGARVWAYPEEADGLWMLVKVEDQVGYASARFLGEVSP